MEPLAGDSDDGGGGGRYGAVDNTAVSVDNIAVVVDPPDIPRHSPHHATDSGTESGADTSGATLEDKTVIQRPTDLALRKDEPDFSIQTIAARRHNGQKLSIKLPPSTQSPTLASPDSDADILGFLDHTPDPDQGCVECTGSHSFGRVFHLGQYLELMPEVFVPEQLVQLRIDSVQPSHSHINIFNNHMLEMQLEHGDFKWTVHRKVKSVAALHSSLVILRTKLKIPAATRDGRQRKQSMRVQLKSADRETDTVDSAGVQPGRVLKYPRRALQTMDASVQSDLQVYLRNVLHHSLFRSHRAVLDFFEISPVSFITELGQKMKEGYVKKRSGGYSAGCCRWCASICAGKYKQRWLVVKDTCIFFLAPENGDVRGVLLMDKAFQVSHGYRITGIRNGILISNLSRSLVFKCDSEFSKKEWYKSITKAQRKYGTEFISQDTRYNSFAPVRPNSYARWYVDGARYMWDVADMLEAAREEIFITDWWMSPEIYLKRPDLTGIRWRLAEVLRRQAERGVRIFILLYKEVELALGISSLLTKQTIRGLHPNIKILRHPDHMAGGVLYWAHHEKLVVVDQMYAFVSGIDLAFGRWDDYRHKLVDVGHAGVQVTPSKPATTGPGGSALGQLVRGTNDVLVNVTKSTPSSRRTSADLDVTQSSIVSSLLNLGDTSCNVDRPGFLEVDGGRVDRPGLLEVDGGRVENGKGSVTFQGSSTPINGSHDRRGFTNTSIIISSPDDRENIPLKSETYGVLGKKKSFRRDKRQHLDPRSSSDEEAHDGRVGRGLREVKRISMDLVEEVKEKGRGMKAWTSNKLPSLQRREGSPDSTSSSEQEEGESKRKSLYKRSRQKLRLRRRMGSTSSLAQAHSALTVEDTTSVHLWVGKDYVNWISKDLNNLDKPFQDIVNRHHTPRMPWHDIGLFVEGPAARDVARHFIERWNAVKTEKAKSDRKYPYLLPRSYDVKSFIPSTLTPKYRVSAQAVRSVGKWSAGIEETEASIFSAYVNLIRHARHYIYIENQFFITSANSSGSRDVSNYIGHEIVERIVQAHNNKEAFRVYILLPLLPAFEGMIGKSSGIAMQFIVYWNYVSISRGKNSMIHCLKERGVKDWQKYLSFCSLRTHACLEGRLVSELVYIHSKLMIVDDRYVIAGSANINDRSMNGNRDSEVCLVIEDHEFEEGIMNGRRHKAGIFASSMRRYLFSEHLGIAEDESPALDVTDPVCEAFFTHTWSAIARRNTEIFEEVFSCYPSDSATTFEKVEKLRSSQCYADLQPAEAMVKVKEIQGHLVSFPLNFLEDEDLKPGVGSKEYLLPMETWT